MTLKEDIMSLVFSFDGKFSLCIMQLWKVFVTQSIQYLISSHFGTVILGALTFLKLLKQLLNVFSSCSHWVFTLSGIWWLWFWSCRQADLLKLGESLFASSLLSPRTLSLLWPGNNSFKDASTSSLSSLSKSEVSLILIIFGGISLVMQGVGFFFSINIELMSFWPVAVSSQCFWA